MVKQTCYCVHSFTVQLMWKTNCFPLIVVVCILATCGAITGYGNTGKCMLHMIMFFRRLMGYHKFCSASGMFVENRIDHLDAPIRRLVYGFYQRLMCSGNSHVNLSCAAQPGCHQICTEIGISVFMFQKWYYNHVFFYFFLCCHSHYLI